MRRLLLPLTLMLALLLVAVLWRPTQATPQGNNPNYLPLVFSAPLPTPSPTAAAGNGVFKLENLAYDATYTGTKAYGFLRFFNGDPVFGGPNNFHVWVCFNGAGCYRSSDVDGTGYYEIPINGAPTPPIRLPGFAYVTKGPLNQETRVSRDFAFDTRQGTCWRMDFRECGTGTGDPLCQLSAQELMPPQQDLSQPDVPQGTCPP